MTSTQTARSAFPEYAPPAAVSLEPVAPSERIAGLDVLRGWAMFGVLWSNLNDWYWPGDSTARSDSILSFVQDWPIESRFYTLLCLLFGVGFAIQLTRAQSRGADLRNVYLRRSGALLGIGMIHAFLIWHGDVLISYAIASFALLLFRDASPRQQLAWGIVLTCIGAYVGNHIHFALGQIYRVGDKFAGGTPYVYAHGTWLEIQRERFHDVWMWWGYFGLNGYLGVVGAFLLGAWAYRSGLVERVITNRRTTWKFLGICAAVALFGYSVELFHWTNTLWPPLTRPPESLLSWRAWNPRNVIMGALDQTDRAEGLVYASLVLLVFQTSFGKRLLAPLAAAGRMGLTTYLTQSVVCTTLFYSYGLGWFGTASLTRMLAITVTLFALQMAVGVWWLKRFRFGPVEWLWRTIAYGRAPAMRVARS